MVKINSLRSPLTILKTYFPSGKKRELTFLFKEYKKKIEKYEIFVII